MRQFSFRGPVSSRSAGGPRDIRSRFALALGLLAVLLLGVALGGCAGRARTGRGTSEGFSAGGQDTSAVPDALTQNESGTPAKQTPFVQRYEVAKRLVLIGELKQAASQLKRLKRGAKSGLEKAMMNEVAASLYLARRELRRAEDAASRALEADRSFGPAYRTRALVRRQKEDVSGAMEDFISALALLPDDRESLRGLAEIYLAQGQVAASINILGKFLEVDPLDAWAQDTWCTSMAALLGYPEFPLDYLRVLGADAVTRGELAALMIVELESARLQTKDERFDEGGVNIPDVPDCHALWFEPFVKKAVGWKLLRLYPDGTFRPGDVARKGPVAVELYYFVSKYCAGALAPSSEGESEFSDAGENAPSFGRRDVSGYVDVDSSSYLWIPAVSMARLGIVRPDSDVLFGAGSVLAGREARDVAGSLARMMISVGCDRTR